MPVRERACARAPKKGHPRHMGMLIRISAIKEAVLRFTRALLSKLSKLSADGPFVYGR